MTRQNSILDVVQSSDNFQRKLGSRDAEWKF